MRYQSKNLLQVLPKLKAQRGVAIITAMLVVALGTITVVAMTSRQQLDLTREQNEAIIQDARSFATSGEDFAAALLFLDAEQGLRENTDSLDDDWAQTLPPISIDSMLLQGCIVDMQGRFNLNNVVNEEGAVDEAQYAVLRRLLTEIGIDPVKAEAILDWVDKDLNATIPEGAEDDYYTGLTPAYRTTNGPFSSVSELRLVKGFSPSVEEEKEDYDLLLPHVAALPTVGGQTQINVNTATPELVASLSDFLKPLGAGLSRWDTGKYADYPECEDLFDLDAEETAPDALAQDEELEPYLSVAEFDAEAAADTGEDLYPPGSVGVSSRYFQIRVDVTSESGRLTQYSLLERDDQGRSRVIFRTRDTL